MRSEGFVIEFRIELSVIRYQLSLMKSGFCRILKIVIILAFSNSEIKEN